MSAPVVSRLAITAVKGTRLRQVEQIELTATGARGDREFFVVDERMRMVNGKQLGELQRVVADAPDGRLSLSFPDGRVVDGEVTLGEAVDARFYSRPRTGRLVEGPFSEALSDHVGKSVRLLRSLGSVDRGARGAASLISSASLSRLAQEADRRSLDSRRFRMLIEVDGLGAHAEDDWVGRATRIGDALVRWRGHVGRCLITSRDPDSGVIDLPTLDLLGSYRRGLDRTESLPFGIYGEVLAEGRVRVGDPVSLLP